jgi:hypothetical protein
MFGTWCSRLGVRDLVFELILALGFQQVSAPMPHAFSVEGRRFEHIAGGYPAMLAEQRLCFRRQFLVRGEEVIPAAAWEAEVLDLEATLWRAAYEENPDTDELARLAARAWVAYRAAEVTKTS